MTLPLMLSIAVGSFVERTNIKKELAIVATVTRVILVMAIICSLSINNYIILSIFLVTFLIGFTSDIINTIRASWMKVFLSESQYKSDVSIMSSATMLFEGLGFAISSLIIALGNVKSFIFLDIIFLFH